jgi:uncharacterized protein (DUF1330 family)
MSAYVIIEASVLDEESRDRYVAQAGPILRGAGGENLVFGSLQTLFGKPAFDNGSILHFQNRNAALAWYHSPAYQAILDLRDAGLACRFRLIG